MSRFSNGLLLASGILVLALQVGGANVGPLLMHGLFAFAFFWRENLWPDQRKQKTALRLGLTIIVCGLLLELFSWLSNYLNPVSEPALLHPQLGPDLLLAFGFYTGWALAWVLVLHRWRFSIWEAYAAQGLYGVVVEQDGAILFSFNPLLWAYVFVAYGATVALALLPFRQGMGGEKEAFGKFPAVIVACYFLTQITFLAGALLWDGLGLIPERQPIADAPFW